VRIGMILVKHPPERKSPIFPEVVRLLESKGADVDIIRPDEQATDLDDVRVEHDLYVLKSGTETALSFAGALHTMGAAILNPYPASALLRDKVITSKVLQAAGVPVPDTYVAGRVEQLEPLLAAGPLVVKPYRGSQGQGVRVIRDSTELAQAPTAPGPVFAQRYHEPDGADYKIYSIGGTHFGVRRTWPVKSYEDKQGMPFVLSPELSEIASQAGRALGIALFGIDVVLSVGRYYVVDASSFPGFKGVPDAASLLAEYIHSAGARVMRGEPLLGAPNAK